MRYFLHFDIASGLAASYRRNENELVRVFRELSHTLERAVRLPLKHLTVYGAMTLKTPPCFVETRLGNFVASACRCRVPLDTLNGAH